MITAALLLLMAVILMPVLLIAMAVAVGQGGEPFPDKHNLWQLPRRSSVL